MTMVALLGRFMNPLERNQREARNAGFVLHGKSYPSAAIAHILSTAVWRWMGLHAKGLAGGDPSATGKREAGAMGLLCDGDGLLK
jgi:hypothetical protein